MLPAKAPRARRDALVAARALALVLILPLPAACGGGDEGGRYGSDGQPPSSGTDLEIRLDRDGEGGKPAERAALLCQDGGEQVPSAEACRLAAAIPADAAEPVPPGVACTEIYGGPDVVRLTGTLEGERVDAELTRENGCEIDRFERFAPLVRELFPGYRPGEALTP